MNYNDAMCIDNGTENCPCHLAKTGDCLVCSRLQGKDCCDCQWQGVCVYNEFIQGDEKVNNLRTQVDVRIVLKKRYLDDLYVLGLDVGKGFALKSSKPGSYVFLKNPQEECCYYLTPISIMHSDTENGIIYVTVKVISAKTKSLCAAEDKLSLRGIYRGGLVGLNKVTDSFDKISSGEKVLIISKGVGFAPGSSFLNWAYKKAYCDFFIDLSKINKELVRDYIRPGTAENIVFSPMEDFFKDNSQKLKTLIEDEKYTSVVLLGSDYFINIAQELNLLQEHNCHLVFCNNSNICCGEGLCGACTCVDSNGVTHKRCKETRASI